MATFTNSATLSYNGLTTTSNTVTGTLTEVLTADKNSVSTEYTVGDTVTYVISMVNSGAAPLTSITVSDDLGAYTYQGQTVYPLTYLDGTAKLYINGVIQGSVSVTAGPPLVFAGINLPGSSNASIIYETTVNNFAPLAPTSTVNNQATITGGGLTTPLLASTSISAQNNAELVITKSLCPLTVVENGQISYTFYIQNIGNTAAGQDAAIVVNDTFNPILSAISVTFNDDTLLPGTGYDYDTATGVFSTISGVITVPAATYTRNTDGSFTVNPGTSVLTVTGTV